MRTIKLSLKIPEINQQKGQRCQKAYRLRQQDSKWGPVGKKTSDARVTPTTGKVSRHGQRQVGLGNFGHCWPLFCLSVIGLNKVFTNHNFRRQFLWWSKYLASRFCDRLVNWPNNFMRLEVIKAVSMSMLVVWVITLYGRKALKMAPVRSSEKLATIYLCTRRWFRNTYIVDVS
jgi:hypothetical protein